MTSVVLVDSCIFIALSRQRLDPVTELLQRTQLEDLATCGMVEMEVLRGARVPKVKARLAEFFGVLQYVPTDYRIWEQATETAWELGRRGVALPSPDILIATCAQRIGAGVLTFDQHFDKIPGLQVFHSLAELD